jgi:hypothetical protein
MRRRTQRPTTMTTHELLERWLGEILVGVRGDTRTIEAACADVVEAIVSRPDHLGGSLRRYGRQLGAEGWLLSELTRWIHDLTELAAERAPLLQRFDAGVELAQGWADGYLYGMQACECTDGLTGLVTLPVLRLRLGQVYDQCRALAVLPEQVYCLAVIDTDFADRPPLERDASMVVLAEQVLQSFESGETVAVRDGRILVLASRTEATHEVFLMLIGRLQQFPLLGGGRVIGWIEELPGGHDLLDGYLLDLAA